MYVMVQNGLSPDAASLVCAATAPSPARSGGTTRRVR